MPPGPSHPAPAGVRSSRRAGAVHDLLDEVDVAAVVTRQAPWQLAALPAALATGSPGARSSRRRAA